MCKEIHSKCHLLPFNPKEGLEWSLRTLSLDYRPRVLAWRELGLPTSHLQIFYTARNLTSVALNNTNSAHLDYAGSGS